MGFIRFCNHPTIYEAKVMPISANVVAIEFKNDDVLENNSGFLFSVKEDMSVIYGNYSKYTTVYRVTEEALYLSTDGSVYPESSETPKELTMREEIQCLKKENSMLAEELTNTQLALCEVYELIGG